MKQLLVFFFFISLFTFKASGQNIIPANDIPKHLGEIVSVTEKVCSVKTMTTTITQLNLGGDAQHQSLIVLYKMSDDSKSQPDLNFKGREITVTGKLITYNGKPGMMITDPKKLRVVMTDNIVKMPFQVK